MIAAVLVTGESAGSNFYQPCNLNNNSLFKIEEPLPLSIIWNINAIIKLAICENYNFLHKFVNALKKIAQ